MTFAFDLSLRAALVLFVALIATSLMRRATASTRHLAWALATVAVLLLPVAILALPEWPVLPEAADAFTDTALEVSHAEPPSGRPPARATDLWPRQSGSSGLQTARAAMVLWLIGTVILLARIAAGRSALRRLARHAQPAGIRLRALLRQLAERTGVNRRITLLVSSDVAMPMTWGTRRPVLLLPATAHAWSDDRLRVVLLHELAHVRRLDALAHELCRAMVACHWINPLAWVALRLMTREREQACDDLVIAAGEDPADYADHLLGVARTSGTMPRWANVHAMARSAELEGRLLSILAPHRLRASPLAAPAMMLATTVMLLALATAVPAGAMRYPQPESRRAAGPLVVDAEGVASDRREVSRRKVLHDALVGALDEPSEGVRARATIAIATNLDDSAIEPLLAALKDPSARVRQHAALGLTFRRHPQVVEALLVAAADTDARVRGTAVFALATSGDRRAVAPLMAAGRDPDQQVREKAAVGLSLLGR